MIFPLAEVLIHCHTTGFFVSTSDFSIGLNIIPGQFISF